MKKFFKRLTKRLYVKAMLWYRYRFCTNVKSSEDNEKICTAICRKLMNHPDSKFLIAPLSYKRYIKNSKLGLFVVMDERRVAITNHVYHYDVVLQQTDWIRLTQLFDSKTEKIRQEYETEIKSQIIHSLSTILEKIN
jgi:hypothetical protein